MFFLRLKGVSHPDPMVACIGELSDTHFKQECKWVNDSDALNINKGNIYGMPRDCGPWYLTVFAPESSNTTELSVEVSEPYDPLVFRWFRVITNLALMPAICIALRRRYYAEAIIYTLTLCMSVVSSIYSLSCYIQRRSQAYFFLFLEGGRNGCGEQRPRKIENSR